MTHRTSPVAKSSSGPALTAGTPVWLDEAPTTARKRFPSLRGRVDAEVVIVGGGITGSTVAALFAEAGVDVCLLEGAHVARGSTSASTALLLQEPDKGLLDLQHLYGAQASRRIWRLSHDAAQGLADTLRRFRIACDLRPRDSIYYTTRHETVPQLRAELDARRLAGFAGTWLSAGALRRSAAVAGPAAIRTVGNAQFDPLKASLGLIGTAARLGARVHEHSRVLRVQPDRTGVRVFTRGGVVRAATVIVATGYATPQFRPLAGRFAMHRTYVMATAPLTRRQRTEIGVGPVMLWDTERPYHYARWTRDHRLLIGGEDRLVKPGAARRSAFTTATAALRAHFCQLLPALHDIPFDHAWEGLFAMTPDTLPFIGPHRRYPRHLFALGYGGNGMTFGYLAATQLLQQWRGERSPDHDLFAFSRPIARRGM